MNKEEQLEAQGEKFVYNSIREFVDEWKESGSEASIWEYYGIHEHVFKQWFENSKRGIFDA